MEPLVTNIVPFRLFQEWFLLSQKTSDVTDYNTDPLLSAICTFSERTNKTRAAIDSFISPEKTPVLDLRKE